MGGMTKLLDAAADAGGVADERHARRPSKNDTWCDAWPGV